MVRFAKKKLLSRQIPGGKIGEETPPISVLSEESLLQSRLS